MTAPNVTLDEQIAFIKSFNDHDDSVGYSGRSRSIRGAILSTLQSIKDAGDDAGHELGLWPMGALAAVARLKSERDEFRKALVAIVDYEHPHCTMPQDLQAIATAAIDSARNK